MQKVYIDSFVFRIKASDLSLINGIKAETLKNDVLRPTQEQKDRYASVTNRSYDKTVRRASSVLLLEHERGIVFTAIEWQRNGYLDIAVHGLHQYNNDGSIAEFSIQSRQALIEMLNQLENFVIRRVDYAIDMKKLPSQVQISLGGKRTTKRIGTTAYYQPRKQREKENPKLKITLYYKDEKDDLSFAILRLEFALKSHYWTNESTVLGTLDKLIKTKGEKVLKRWINQDVTIQGIVKQ